MVPSCKFNIILKCAYLLNGERVLMLFTMIETSHVQIPNLIPVFCSDYLIPACLLFQLSYPGMSFVPIILSRSFVPINAKNLGKLVSG